VSATPPAHLTASPARTHSPFSLCRAQLIFIIGARQVKVSVPPDGNRTCYGHPQPRESYPQSPTPTGLFGSGHLEITGRSYSQHKWRCPAPARLAGPLSTQLLCPHKSSLPDLSSGSHGIRQPNCNLLPSSLYHSSLALGTLVLHHRGGLRAMTQTVIRTIRNCCVRLQIEDPTSVLAHANCTNPF
jgi:hypothetical protein